MLDHSEHVIMVMGEQHLRNYNVRDKQRDLIDQEQYSHAAEEKSGGETEMTLMMIMMMILTMLVMVVLVMMVA